MEPYYVRGIALSTEILGRDKYQVNDQLHDYSRLRLSLARQAETSLTSGDGAARCHSLRKGPAALGATFVNPAGEGGWVQHGASFARMVGKPNPTAAFRGRPDQGFHSQLFSLGLKDLSLGLTQAKNPGSTTALGAALVHAYLAGRGRAESGSEVRCHNPSPLNRANLAWILPEFLSGLNLKPINRRAKRSAPRCHTDESAERQFVSESVGRQSASIAS